MSDQDIETEQTLRDIYYSPTQGFRSTENIFQQAKKTLPHLKKQAVVDFLKSQKVYTAYKHRTMTKTFRQTWVKDFDQVQVDLIDFANSKNVKNTDNDGYDFVLVCVEILSRFAFTAKLKSRTSKNVADHFEVVLELFKDKFEKYPKIVQVDDGKEFMGDFAKTVKRRDMELWISKGKAHIVERFNRTLEEKMKKYWLHFGKNRWVDVLPQLTENYNHQVNRSIGMPPDEVNEENKHQVWLKLFGQAKGPVPKPKYEVGDRVRVYDYVMHQSDLFKWKKENREEYELDKERRRDKTGQRRTRSDRDLKTASSRKYTVRFSDEVFLISEVKLGHPPIYKLYSDKTADNIFGIFYEWELSHVK